MTTIAYRGGVMAADRRCSAQDVHQCERTKVEKIGGWLVGVSGDLMHVACLRSLIAEKLEADTFVEGHLGKFEWADETYMSAIVVSPRHEIYFIENTKAGVVAAAKVGAPFVARGSGRDFALAAMRMGANAYEAVEIAAEFDCHTGDGVDTVELAPIAALSPAPSEGDALGEFMKLPGAVRHDGTGIPVPYGTEVGFIRRNGMELLTKAPEDFQWKWSDHASLPSDILAYRPIAKEDERSISEEYAWLWNGDGDLSNLSDAERDELEAADQEMVRKLDAAMVDGQPPRIKLSDVPLTATIVPSGIDGVSFVTIDGIVHFVDRDYDLPTDESARAQDPLLPPEPPPAATPEQLEATGVIDGEAGWWGRKLMKERA